MKNIFYVIAIIFLSSCNSKDKIKITLLNDGINAVNFQNIESGQIKTILKLKFENLSSNNIVISNYCFPNQFTHCSGKHSFPERNKQLSLNNLLIKTNSQNVKVKFFMVRRTDKMLINEALNDSLEALDYKELGYKRDNLIFFNKELTDNLIFIKSHETIYFETYIKLPLSFELQEYVEITKDNDYKANIVIHSDTTYIKKYLTWSQLKNIEENNYKLFHGTIVSENAVPIVFVE